MGRFSLSGVTDYALYDSVERLHCACPRSLELCSSNILSPKFPGLTTTKVCFSAHLACPTQDWGRLWPSQRPRCSEDPFSGLCDSKEDQVDSVTWGLPCFSQEMTIVTSAHVSLVRSSHVVLVSWKEDKCNSRYIWKEKRTKCWSTPAMLTSSAFWSNDCFTFVPTQKAFILPPTVENQSLIDSSPVSQHLGYQSGAWMVVSTLGLDIFFSWSKDSCTEKTICNHGIGMDYRNKYHHTDRAMNEWTILKSN